MRLAESTAAETAIATRLVLVEDNPGDAYLVREMLSSGWRGDIEVSHFERLSDARDHLLAERATCVLLDLSLPDAHGLEAVEKVQTIAPDVPIVVLSGHDDEDMALRAVQGGAQDYLIKGRVDDALITRSIRYAIERKRSEVALAHAALHDALTGLPNRALFLDRLKLALARGRRHGAVTAVLFLDLDRFKVINDSLGHEAGDQVLLDTGRRLQQALRPGDTVARFGGDEFTALCEEVPGERAALLIAERMADAVATPFLLDDGETFLTASIGIAMVGGPQAVTEEVAESLVRDADAAMYRAKERGRSRVELFDQQLRERAVERLAIESALHRALDRDELRLHYQPQVDLRSGRIVSWEALVRWEHPERGLLGPSDFIPVAEETGLINPLGTWVVEEACRQAARWSESLNGSCQRMAVNLSGRQLGNPDLVETIARALAMSGLDPGTLCLEVTESVVLEESLGAVGTLEALHEMGVELAIDDFGSGYSALSSLKRLDVDVLKLDRPFVAELGSDPTDGPILAAIVDLAHAVGLKAIAEGIERPEQLAVLRALGCDVGQGFFFGRPAPPDAAEALAASSPRF